jgi:hypothetical protein
MGKLWGMGLFVRNGGKLWGLGGSCGVFVGNGVVVGRFVFF